MKPSDLFSHWKQIRAGLVETIDKYDIDQLSYVPFAGSWSAAEIMLHIADAEDGWFRHVVTGELDEWPSHYTVENYPTPAAIKRALADVHRHTEIYLDSLSEADLEQKIETPWGKPILLRWIIWHVLEHEVHHRGELSLILGILGKEGLDV
jgi:uncharacterized damage-inducible protein DinB